MRISMVNSVNAPISAIEPENAPPEDGTAVAASIRAAEDASIPDAASPTDYSPPDGVPSDFQSASSSRRFGLQPRDQLFVGLLAGATLALSALHAFQASRWSLQPVELSHHPEREWEFHLDINSANWVEWMQLEGIGERLALRIVEDRKTNGPFQSIDDLDRVNGIGPKTIEKLRPHLRCEPVKSKDEGGRMKDE
ncbi:MAG: helix-hairpin-helix domain-containing protein [Planctomycetaceae bacterium]